MAEVPMLFPMEPKEFWQQLRKMIEEVVEQKNTSPANRPAENQTKKTLLKATEICELFQVSKPTVYEWMKQGKLQSVKIQSSHTLFDAGSSVQSSPVKA